MPRAKPVRLFISYSSKDQRYKNDLETHLSVLRDSKLIKSWDMGEIVAGTEWDPSVKKNLAEAQVILLLVTANFLASKYITRVELKTALKRHKDGTAVVIPIIVSESEWEETPLKKIQALPPKGQPIVSKGRHKGWFEVAQGIRQALKKISGDARTLEAPTKVETAHANRVAAMRKGKKGRKSGDALRSLAREYERVIRTPGDSRTAMERIYTEMRGAAAATTVGTDKVLRELTSSKTEGERLAAVAMLERRPDKRYVSWLGSRFKAERTAFVEYHAATALLAAANTLGKREKRLVQSAINQGLRGLGPKGASTDRAGVLLQAEAKLSKPKRRS